MIDSQSLQASALRRLRAALIGVLLFTGWPVRATAADLHEILADYTLTTWGRKDGLAGPIWAITEDRDGYLWLGTDDGLVRFDGVRFVPWEALGGSPLPHEVIRALSVSSDGSLWIGFGGGGGLAQIRAKHVRTYGDTDGIAASPISAIVEDRGKTVWAGSDAGLFRWSGGKWEKLGASQGLPDTGVTTVYVDSSGTLWVGTTVGLFWQPIASEESFQQIDASTDVVRGLSEDATGRIWATDPRGGFRSLGYRMPSEPGPEPGRGSRLARDRRGDLWVATLGQGLWRVRQRRDPSQSTTEKTTVLSGLSSDTVQSLFEDTDGNIWAGTSEGLDRLTPHRVTPITGLGLVSAIDAAHDGHMWVATAEELIRFSQPEGSWQSDGIRWPLPNTHTLRVDANGGVWGATSSGLFRLASNRLARVPLPADQSASGVDAITTDRGAGMWIVRSRDVFHWDGRLELLDRLPLLGRARVTSAYADRGGQLWVAFTESRIGVWSGRGQVRFYGVPDGLGTSPYYTFYEDSDGAIWIGGNDGLTRFANGRFSSITRDNGLPAGGVFAIAEDDSRQLWLATSSGILRLARSEFEAATANNLDQIQFQLYDTSDGLAGFPDWLGDRTASRAADGTLWFVTSRGLTIVDPRLLNSRRTSTHVDIESASADDRRLDPAVENTLPAGTGKLQIQYTVPNLTSPLKTRFRYRLEGFDADWIDAGTRRQALYTNLPPRPYRFRVTTNAEGGGWVESDVSWNFSIKPMFYQTLWFYTVLTAGLAGMVWAAWWLRVGQLRREFSLVLGERQRLSWELHDTLLQGLVGLALQFDAVSKDLDTSPSLAKTGIVRVREQVEEYIREARRSIWALRSPALHTHDLSEALRESGERATAGTGVGFEFGVSGTRTRYPADIEHQLLRIGQEAVLNSVRHAGARRIRMELRYGENALGLRISDDGAGFDPDRSRAAGGDHYGMTTMRERAQRIGGALTIESAPQSGTVVETIVPKSSRPQSQQV